MEEQNYIEFEAYLSESLTPEELTAFEQRLAQDAELKSSFETYKEFTSFLENKYENEAARNDFKANLKHISEKHFSKEADTTHSETKVVRFKAWQFAIAASVLLLIGVSLFQQFSTPSFSDYNQYDSISLALRGDQDELIQKAETAFNARDFKNAELNFERLAENYPTNLEYQLYHAISLVELDFFDEADAIFGKIAETNSAFKYEAVWRHALSKLKQEKNEVCAALLETIPQQDQNYENAQKLLKKLN